MIAQSIQQQQPSCINQPNPIINMSILQEEKIISQDEQIFNKAQNKKSIVVPSMNNFIKLLRKGLNNNIICIYEQQPFVVQIRNINQFLNKDYELEQNNYKSMNFKMQYQDNDNLNTKQIYNIGTNKQNVLSDIYFQSVPYDCLQFKPNNFLISSKSMPPRIYSYSNQSSQKISHIASITNKKKNSQKYLSPIQFAHNQKKPQYIIGGGHRFLAAYNLQKMFEDNFQIFQKFSKSNISSVSMINQNVGIIGGFQGWLGLFDFRQGCLINQINNNSQNKQLKGLMRPHVDAIMSIATTSTNQNIFATSARKDDFTYIWDIRTYSQSFKYLTQLNHSRNGNQRINLNFSNNGSTLYMGTQTSQIIAWNYKISNQQNSLQVINKWKIQQKFTTINSVLNFNSQFDKEQLLIFSTGERIFENYNEDQSSQDQKKQMKDQAKQNLQHNNILGLIKIHS